MSFYNCCSCTYPEEKQRINSLFALLSEREAGARRRIFQSEKLLINTQFCAYFQRKKKSALTSDLCET